MKKRKLFFKTLFSTIAIPSTVNFLIFHKAKNKINKTDGEYYNWKYGKIFYTTKGNGEPLLLLHGIGAGCNCLEWSRNVDVLAKYYKVYTIDMIGFGKSDKPNMTYTAYLYSQLIIDFINDIIKKPSNIVASSLSGAFAVMACSLFPNLFTKLLLICPSGIGDTNTKFNKNDQFIKMLINSPILGTSIYNYITSKRNCSKFLVENIFFNPSNITDEIINEYYYSSHYKNANAKYAVASFMSNYMNVNIENALSKITLPLYVIWGKNAVLSPISNIEIIKQLNQNIKYAIFDQTKLLPHSENPREFNKICKEFF